MAKRNNSAVCGLARSFPIKSLIKRAWLACFAVSCVYCRAGALPASTDTSRNLIMSGFYYEQTTIGNTVIYLGNDDKGEKVYSLYKTGGAYSLLGGTGHLGYGTIGNARYSINWGTINVLRPAQDNVDTSHAYPNPCNLRKGCDKVIFTRLTSKATLRVYTVSGELVRTIRKNDNSDSQEWDLKNENGRQVSSGLYIYFNQGGGTSKKGKLVIVR